MSGAAWAALSPHVLAVALCAVRLAPVALLCPLLGGQALPAGVRLGPVLALALFAHLAGGVHAPAGLEAAGAWALGAAALREAGFGVALGMCAALPFDAARVGGRLADLFRGASAEAALPQVGARETATGDLLYQLLVALAASGPLGPQLVGALLRTFVVVPLGAPHASEGVAAQAGAWAAGALAAGLALGAPLAAASLLADALVGLAGRAAPQLPLGEAAAPLRLLGGGVVLWLGVGALAGRLLVELARAEGAVLDLAEAAR